MICDLMKIDQY